MNEAQNLVSLFLARAEDRGDASFLWQKSTGAWQSMSWAKVARDVVALATALQRLGLAPGDRVMLVSQNRPEFCIADLAIMAAGGITVPTYVTNTEADHAHILGDARPSIIIVSTAKLAQTLLTAVLRQGHAKHVISIEPLSIGQADSVAFHQWDDLIRAHPGSHASIVGQALAITRDTTACLIYTSGTSGAPRGVMQSHGAILMNAAGAGAIVKDDFPKSPDIFLSFLPLSHAYEHTAGQFLPIYLGAQIYYAEGLEKLAANIAEVKPTIMVVVPRLFELLRAKIIKMIDNQGGVAPHLLKQALRLGMQRLDGRMKLLERPLDVLLDLTIRKKIRARFGGQINAMISGGAPLNPEIGQFFAALGMPVLQGYGLTEAGPIVACNRPSAGVKMQSVGPPLCGVEVKIAHDGEILVRGENVMQGYWRRPDESAAAIINSWLHTGDIGYLDEHGRLLITDRKKNIIVNDKGENIAPQKIEGMLSLAPEIFQAMVIGDKRPHLVALIVPDPECAMHWACQNGVRPDIAELCTLPAFHQAMMAAVDKINAQLSVTEKIRRIVLVPDAFTIENGMLTPSIKIRRHEINAVYGARLDALYNN